MTLLCLPACDTQPIIFSVSISYNPYMEHYLRFIAKWPLYNQVIARHCFYFLLISIVRLSEYKIKGQYSDDFVNGTLVPYDIHYFFYVV